MADSDDEETARLRAMRTVAARMDARSGATGGGMQALLDKQRRATQAAASRSSAFSTTTTPAPRRSARVRSPPGRQEGRPEPLVLAPAEDEDAALRAMFPGGFGSKKPGNAARRLSARASLPLTPTGGGSHATPGLDDAPGPAPGPQRPPPADDDDDNDDTNRSDHDADVEEHDDYLRSPTRRPWRATRRL